MSALADQVVAWQAQHGRNHLPWQQTRDPYRVWLSEIMLQQTQVSTVLDYYARFLARFPDVAALASASQDDVLALWSGLGYYSRARHLHRCAQMVMEQHGGRFPPTAAQLAQLPGIGRSTAGAIAAFCFAERVPILDANVRRVLTRVLGFGADLAVAAHERQLWDAAQSLLPKHNLEVTMPGYTQGLMDLGATVCAVRKPSCLLCPLNRQCVALAQGQPEHYPVKTRKLQRQAQSWWLLWLQDDQGRVYLQRRPASGIWAGLYCLPIHGSAQELAQHPALAEATGVEHLPAFVHVLTHRDLHLHPVRGRVGASEFAHEDGGWFTPKQWPDLGLPAPVRKLLSAG
ncbi:MULTISPECIES: A/G-specific adenine glycosylase [Giesbergeria]|uniref:Adenine DNA glycosylase n=1 Tax=Giesbergeria sinuosa TaxID=80883 RepID=A0ABV9Q872_9BURK